MRESERESEWWIWERVCRVRERVMLFYFLKLRESESEWCERMRWIRCLTLLIFSESEGWCAYPFVITLLFEHFPHGYDELLITFIRTCSHTIPWAFPIYTMSILSLLEELHPIRYDELLITFLRSWFLCYDELILLRLLFRRDSFDTMSFLALLFLYWYVGVSPCL